MRGFSRGPPAKEGVPDAVSTTKPSIVASMGVTDRKQLSSLIGQLEVVAKKVSSTDNEALLSAYIKSLSPLICSFANVHFSSRQPSWSNEVSHACSVFSLLSMKHLTLQDFASISRFITRASFEKQLSLNKENSIGIYNLLIIYLKYRGIGCRIEDNQSETARCTSGLLVVHEIMRAIAQLLLTCGDKLQPYRYDALTTLLSYCDHNSVDLESRYAAIDAVGNILAYRVTDAALEAVLGNTHEPKFQKANELWILHEKCALMLIDNLRSAIVSFNSSGGLKNGGGGGLQSRLLVSCLRALSQALNSSTPPSSTTIFNSPSSSALSSSLILSQYLTTQQLQQPLFQQRYQSLVQTAYSIFSNILAPIPLDSAATATTPTRKEKVFKFDSNDVLTDTKLWTHVCRMLSALALYNPPVFMSSWQLFLADSVATENALQALTSSLHSSFLKATPPSAPVAVKLPTFKSPLFSSASRSHISTKIVAIQCFASLLMELPMHKWFQSKGSFNTRTGAAGVKDGALKGGKLASKKNTHASSLVDSITSTIVKIYRFVIAMLVVEKDESVIKELLDVCLVLVKQLPLTTVQNGAMRAADGGIPVLEELSLTMFHTVLRIAVADKQNHGTVSLGCASDESRGMSSSVLALEFLDRVFSNTVNPPKSCYEMLKLHAYRTKVQEVVVSKLDAAESTPSSSSWRKEVKAVETDKSNGSNSERALLFSCVPEPEADVFTRQLALMAVTLCEASANSHHSIACSKVLHLLCTNYPQLLLADKSWFRRFFDYLSTNPVLPLRYIAAKCISALLSKASFHDDFLTIYSLPEVTVLLLLLCSDQDHQVRCEVIGAFGHFSKRFWLQLDEYECSNPSGAPPKHQRVAVIDHLLTLTNDKIGTVRAAAYKALGEFICHGGLITKRLSGSTSPQVSPPSSASDKVIGDAESLMITTILRTLYVGCNDSKLAVRLQAIWALGNLLLFILPMRQKRSVPVANAPLLPEISGTDVTVITDEVGIIVDQVDDCIADHMWMANYNICLKLLDDSEKLLASSVRCMGFITAGLSPWNASHFTQLTNIVDTLIDKILLSTGDDMSEDISYRIQKSINDLPHKLLYSICQALGFIGWVLANKIETNSIDRALAPSASDDLSLPTVYSNIEKVRGVLAILLRHSKIKIQLQACKALISLICFDNIHLDGARMSVHAAFTASIIGTMENALVLVSTYLAKYSSFGSSASTLPISPESIKYRSGLFHGGTGRGQTNGNIVNNNNINKSVETSNSARSVIMQRSLLVLVWVVMRRACDCCMNLTFNAAGVTDFDESFNKLSSISQSIIYHSDDLIKWMHCISAEEAVLTSQELSLTSPPLASTAPKLNFPAVSTAKSVASAVLTCCITILKQHLVVSKAAVASSDNVNDNWLTIYDSVLDKLVTSLALFSAHDISEEFATPKKSAFNGSKAPSSLADDEDDEI